MNLLSVDPGAVHCGYAFWKDGIDSITGELRWKCHEAYELGPDAFLDRARMYIENKWFDRVVAEEFRLQRDKALAQTGSSFGTVEVIGVLRHLCRWNNVPFETVTSLARDAAFIKMKAVKYRFPKDPDGHMKSAVCVGAVATGWRALNHYVGDGVGDGKAG